MTLPESDTGTRSAASGCLTLSARTSNNYHQEEDMNFHAKPVFALLALTAVALPHTAVAQSYPARPIRLILPFPPGGPTDIAGRAIAQKLGEQLGQTVVPDNRPGATSNIGMELAARAAPDG